MSAFLNSLLPSYNAEVSATLSLSGVVSFTSFVLIYFKEFVDDEAGAAGGVDRVALRQGVGSLMEAMRELLNTIRPVAPPVDDEPQDFEPPEDDEWD